MPIYEYRCNKCGEISEILVGIGSEGEGLTCEHCGSRDLTKILSVSSHALNEAARVPGSTCCGREERCDAPPCSTGGTCRKDL